MQIQVNTDNHINGREGLAEHVRGVVESALSHVADRVTRVEAHLSDETGAKGGQEDKRCMLEARLQGRQPTAVTHHASTMDAAIDGAADKLKHAIESTVERLRDQHTKGGGP